MVVTEFTRFGGDGLDEAQAEAGAPCFWRDVEAFHLASTGDVELAQSDAPHWGAIVIAREKEGTRWRRILARERFQLSLEILIGEINVERGGIGAEELRYCREIAGRCG